MLIVFISNKNILNVFFIVFKNFIINKIYKIKIKINIFFKKKTIYIIYFLLN
jgi:hypothetical protein